MTVGTVDGGVRARDALTGLPDRTALALALRVALLRECQPLVLLVIELDRLDAVNEAFGYAAADKLLRGVADRLAARFRDAYAVARLGGDGFAIVLPADRADPYRVDTALGEPFLVGGRTLEIGATVGVARFPEHGHDAELLIRRATSAVQAAKRAGRQHATYASSHDEHREHFRIADELRTAFDHGDLTLHYESQLDLRSGFLVGAEALLRWRHPSEGILAPATCLPAVEGTPLGRRISLWILERAIAQHLAWCDGGVDRPVAVNLSREDLVSDEVAGLLSRAMRTGRIGPKCLTLEVTESTIMADPELAIAALSSFRRLGIRIALDDFGTGHSSLAYLQRISADEVKIDRFFVSVARTDRASAAIVQATIELAHRLGLTVVALGVEDERTLSLLRGFGCDHAQGSAIARPVAPETLAPTPGVALTA